MSESESKPLINNEQVLDDILKQEEKLVGLNDEEIDDDIISENKLENEKQTKSTADFSNIIKEYYDSRPFAFIGNGVQPELEVRFGTRGIKPITKIEYERVIQKIKSVGFQSIDEQGEYSLRIQNEILDNRTGKYTMSRNIRIEIYGLNQIQSYCRTNDLQAVAKMAKDSIVFTNKKPAFNKNNQRIQNVVKDDFNFSVSYQIEEPVKQNVKTYITENWQQFKKTFRYLNRVRFSHPDYPIHVDISIVKTSQREPRQNGRGGDYKRFYTVAESGVFSNTELYEIELEVDNKRVGPGTAYNNEVTILAVLKKVITIILGGLQNSNYPISYPEQKEVIASYMKLLYKETYQPFKPIYPSNFIGPSSYTLQMINISPIDENVIVPNIRKDFVVTEKADGERNLLFIHNNGKIYLINTTMGIVFTGAKTTNKELFQTLLDGELIKHDKNNHYLNLYAAFDIYYLKNIYL